MLKNREQKIPKKFHQVWLWWKELPPRYKDFQKWWLEKNPGWTLHIWDESNIEQLKFFNKGDFEAMKNLSEKSDHLRFIILLEHWGVYIDTDMFCLKNIEPILKECNFFICYDWLHLINAAIMGSIKNHPLLKEIVSKFSKQIESTKDFWKFQASDRLWPNFITKTILKSQYFNKIHLFPEFFFYPIHLSHFYNGEIRLKKPDLSKSYWIHYYDAHWTSEWKRYRRKIVNLPGIQIALIFYLFTRRKLKEFFIWKNIYRY